MTTNPANPLSPLLSPSLPPPLSLICAMARNHAIGLRNDLPWHLPQDLEHFKNLTKGKPIILGRLTYESILARRNGKPLPHRPHYVVTRQNLRDMPEGVQAFADLGTAIARARQDYPDQEVMVIGGASIYQQALPLVSRMYLTILDREVEGDAFFPQWNPAEWSETSRETFTGPETFSFVTFERRKPDEMP